MKSFDTNGAERCIYVSPDGCDDSNGLSSRQTPGKPDGPVATIERARDLVRSVDRTGLGTIRVVLRGGTYHLDRPFRLTGEDSGGLDCPVVYEASPGEHPVISAGVSLVGWKETEHNGRRAWLTEAPGFYFHNLWVNDERRYRPRYPRDELLRTVGPSPGSFYEGTREFRVEAEKIPQFAHQMNVEMVYFAVWTESRLPIESIDREQGVIHTKLRSAMNACEVDCSSNYYFDNVFEELSEPGQWYLDDERGIVYYLPHDAESLENTFIFAPRFVRALEIAGTPESPVSFVRFKGLSFRHAEWWRTDETEIFRWDVRRTEPPCDVRVTTLADDKAADHQAAISCEAALSFVWAKNCGLTDCTVSNVGGSGIAIGAGCVDNRISGSLLDDLGGGGIKIGTQHLKSTEAVTFNIVEDCEIKRCATMFHSAVGLWIGHAAHNQIVHNSIHDMSYTGISVGWVWGYGPSGAYCNVIEFNDVFNIAVDGWMHDLSGIYMLGESPGTVVRNNWIHRVGKDNNVIGIYTDAGSSYIRWENNIVEHADAGYLHSNGKDIVITNNIFAHFNHGLIRGRDESPNVSFISEHNIFYSDQKDMMLDWRTHDGYVFRNNLYWCEDGVEFNGEDFPTWRSPNRDADSVVADPLFVDPDRSDYRLAKDSPAHALGFREFDLADVGPRRNPGAAARATRGTDT